MSYNSYEIARIVGREVNRKSQMAYNYKPLHHDFDGMWKPPEDAFPKNHIFYNDEFYWGHRWDLEQKPLTKKCETKSPLKLRSHDTYSNELLDILRADSERQLRAVAA